VTVKELREALKAYPPRAEVFVYDATLNDCIEIVEVTTDEQAPEEVYIEVVRFNS
jgi:hypothetical protein